MAGLNFDVRHDDGHVTIAVAGEVDLATAPELAARLAQYPDRDVTVDLADVAFLDSSGLTVLAVARTRLAENGHSLRTTNEQEHVRRVIEVAGLDKLFHDD